MVKFTEVLQFFLCLENKDYWRRVQELADKSNSAKNERARRQANTEIYEYVLEAQRLTSSQRNLRICAADTVIKNGDTEQVINGVKYAPGADIPFKRGDTVVCMLGPACMDESVIPKPTEFKPGRSREAYMHFGFGPHECLDKEIALTFIVGMIKICAGLKNLRHTPGATRLCKSIEVNHERLYLNDSWSYLTFDPTSKFHDFMKGNC